MAAVDPASLIPRLSHYESLLYSVDGPIATITLNRPKRMNAIDVRMPFEIADAVGRANDDDNVRVIVLTGSGNAFCAGYDLKIFAESKGFNQGYQAMPWDPTLDYKMMKRNTDLFFTLFRSYKPTIAAIRGFAVGGGSDIALSCDFVVMTESARIGYPPARVWGCPTTAMWQFRLTPQKAKRMLLTGDVIDGTEAESIGLIDFVVPDDQLDRETLKLAARVAKLPLSQATMMKLVINSSLENQGLASAQTLANLFDGVARHSPDGVAFKERCEQIGFREAVRERDEGDNAFLLSRL